jgi:hypothetical protein
MVTSPQPNSGKSTLLGVLGFLTPRSLLCVGLNEAVLFRSIDYWTPCLITDEADTVFADNEPLRAVYNSGWTRGSGVPRCIGDDHVPKLFATFCPKVLGLKGKSLPDTTASRCIVIELKRKLPREAVQDFAHIDDDVLATLRRKLARWADDNWEGLSKAQPQIPAGFDNPCSPELVAATGCMAQGNGGEARGKNRGKTRQPLPGLRLRVERLPRRQNYLEHQVRYEEGPVHRK